jgi:hypothetical protein
MTANTADYAGIVRRCALRKGIFEVIVSKKKESTEAEI